MQPVAYHVRSERNTIVIDFDKPSAKAAPYILPPATRAVDPLEALGLDGTRAPAAPAPAVVPSRRCCRPRRRPHRRPGRSPCDRRAARNQNAVQVEQPGTGRKFSGHAVSLDFQGADLRAVLRTFAEISGLNIVIDPAVQGTG